jgi:hypothetical protein
MRQQPFIVVGTADRYRLNTMNLVARVLMMIASTYGKNPTSQRVIVAGSRIQSVGASGTDHIGVRFAPATIP